MSKISVLLAGQATTESNDEATADPVSTKRKAKPSANPVILQFTIREPDWSYVHLRLVTPASLQGAIDGSHPSDKVLLDEVTAYLHLQSALRRYLGVHGTAIPLDILKVDGLEVWIRSPREDANAVVAAAGGWVGSSGEGWRVVDWQCWGPTEGEDGRDLFG
ncbi:Hypothetical protein D9617_1g086930 [Elsinoe fawcettii]|nr:Hypothetical protein D9617_1g086930 [Elsinoe fawcettii]